MSATESRRGTLLELCVSRAGYLRGGLVCEFVIEWAICTEGMGQEPTIGEFARWWKDRTERTTWRRLASFKKAFPEYATPGPLAEQLLAQVADVEHSRAAARSVRLAIA